jgi:hypothetical protein
MSNQCTTSVDYVGTVQPEEATYHEPDEEARIFIQQGMLNL